MSRPFPLLLLLAGCGTTIPEDAVQLQWAEGDLFHVGARYRVAVAMTEEQPVDLDGTTAPSFGEHWSDDVVWSFQVVETGLVPAPGDELYRYALGERGVEKIAVVRAFLDETLNTDEELLAADPVVYLVFREERNRLGAIVSFTSDDGGRKEAAWSTTALGRSWSPLSQSMLTAVPTYLAPWSATYTDRETTLENGSLLTTEADGDVVDVLYDDEVGGGLVASRYEKGAPWPTWTVTDNVESWLMSETEVGEKRVARVPALAEPPEDFDYQAALSASIDIEAALTLDADTMDGGFDDAVYAGFEPWAGSWWPLKQGALVFGYDGRDTISDRLKDRVDPLKQELDGLSTEIREMGDGAEKDAKVETYRQKQSELVDVLVEFYGGVLQDLDGGRLTVGGGKVTHVDGWSYELDELSPMDKLALDLWARGETSPNPFYGPAWEILNHYNPAGGSWWGHCNGWAAAAILTNEPRESVTSSIRGETVTYTTADLKGLLTETHYSTYSRFYGARYDGPDDDISDLSPAAFHRLVSFYIRDQGVPLVFDTSANEEVWNFPAWNVDLTVVEGEGSSGDKVNVNTADKATLAALPGMDETLAANVIERREIIGPFQTPDEVMYADGITQAIYDGMKDAIVVAPQERTFEVEARVTFTSDGVAETWVDSGSPESIEERWSYTLVTDADGLVLRGTWADDGKHPDFAWVPYENPTGVSSRGSENPYVPYGELLAVIGSGFERE